ncbi:MAG TPA: DEAD/DEAH box helicase family protein [Flavisolibacter sp.]|nr:DEAD/DEAH box helicase family protein [Flavisolibacter sp.]
MTAKPKPRPYQIKAVNQTLDMLMNQPGACPIIATPPGGGKSLLIAWTAKALATTLLAYTPRFLIITHVKELIEQDAKALDQVWTKCPMGIYSAGLNSRISDQQITIASVKSVYMNLEAFGKVAGIFVDEAHLISPVQETMYQQILTHFRKLNPTVFIAGYSATPWRMKHGKLTEGNIFNCVAFDNTQRDEFVELIDDGYLVPLIPKHVSFRYDISKVHKVAGDFNRTELEAAVNIVELSEKALQESLQVAADRKHWIIFCSGIAHVTSVTALLVAMGQKAVCVHSKMGRHERDSNINAYRNGDARIIVNDGILTTGFDSPWTDCIVLLKPTASPGLHVQILGRGIRPVYVDGYDLDLKEHRLLAIKASGRENCLVLDFAGNTMRLGPINDPVLPKKRGKGTGEVPIKICPECGTYCHAAQRFCTGLHWNGTPCTHEFKFETKLEDTAATEQLIARNEPATAWFPVDRVVYEHHSKPNKPLMMKVHYHCGIRRFTEFVCIEHENDAGLIAVKWWKARLPNYPPPPTTVDGLGFVKHLPKPTHIFVHYNTRYPRILDHSFDGSTPIRNLVTPQGFTTKVTEAA